MDLRDIIIEKIERDGPISFHDFMDMALYYPGHGYYTSNKNHIGKSGDYYTTPYMTHIFGEMLARQIEEMWERLGKQPFTIIEYGGGNGAVSQDILSELSENRPLFENINYYIIEINDLRGLQKDTRFTDKVKWCKSMDEIDEINGCVFSNELIDNFPVHKVVMEEELMEVFVSYEGSFCEVLKPARNAIKEYLKELGVTLPKGFRTEINLKAIDWINEVAGILKKGVVLKIDYGYTSPELYGFNRSSGTLLCYHNHTISDQFYNNIGEQDITAHVNFSALNHWGVKNGLSLCGFTNQARFLLSLGLSEHLRLKEKNGIDKVSNEKYILINTFLLDMGKKFKVLIQQKGLPGQMLSGLKFSQHI